MQLTNTIRIESRQVRLAIVFLLLLASAVYYLILTVMYVFEPFPDILPLLLVSFTVPMAAAVLAVHFIRRPGWNLLAPPVAIALAALPFLVVTLNFLDGLTRRGAELIERLPLLEFLAALFALAGLYLSVQAVMAVVIGLGFVCYRVFSASCGPSQHQMTCRGL